MNEQQGVVRSVHWRELFPWLLIIRTYRLAISFPVLICSLSAVLLIPLGWNAAHVFFIRQDTVGSDTALERSIESNGSWPVAVASMPGGVGHAPTPNYFAEEKDETTSTEPAPVAGPVRNSILAQVYLRMIDPVQQLTSRPATLSVTGYYVTGLIWTMFVWAFFAGAISRISVLELGKHERVGLFEALGFAFRRLHSFFFAPLFPVLGIAAVLIPLWLLGLLMKLPIGVLIGGICWVFVIIAALLIVVVGIGLAFGWPLMWGVVGAERDGDVFEAFSRSYSYVFQRPLHYLFYVAVASLLGYVCWLFTFHCIEAIVLTAKWSVGYAGPAADATGIQSIGDSMIAGVTHLIRTIGVAFCYAYFWCSSAAIYLLLRRDTDQTDFDEVYTVQDDEPRALPGMTSDADGVPQVVAQPE
jgi:hypothetical protein